MKEVKRMTRMGMGNCQGRMCGPAMQEIMAQKVGKRPFPSFRRKPESRKNKHFWTPAFAGVTALMTFYEPIKFERRVKSI
jgi:hypothetical protein